MNFILFLNVLFMVLRAASEFAIVVLAIVAITAFNKWVRETEELKPSLLARARLAWKVFKQNGIRA